MDLKLVAVTLLFAAIAALPEVVIDARRGLDFDMAKFQARFFVGATLPGAAAVFWAALQGDANALPDGWQLIMGFGGLTLTVHGVVQLWKHWREALRPPVDAADDQMPK